METSANLATIQPFSSSSCVRLTHEILNSDSLTVIMAPVIDEMGLLSAKSQSLSRTLTSYEKLMKAPDQVLYVLWAGLDRNRSVILGFLKCARRILYLHDSKSQCLVKRNPVCLLDFFVHDDVQRRGYGKVLYDAMLKTENVLPAMVAVDKPSESLLRFLHKNYGLLDPCWQANNFVVYPGFFDYNDFLPSPTSNGASMVTDQSHFTPDLTSSVPQSKSSVNRTSNVLPQTAYNLNATSPIGHVPPQAEQRENLPEVLVPSPVAAHRAYPDSIFTNEHQNPDELSAVAKPAPATPMASLAKERKLLSMGHHKLW